MYYFKNDRIGTYVAKMCIDSKYTSLFAADNNGFIYHWNIANYARKHKETKPPTCSFK